MSVARTKRSRNFSYGQYNQIDRKGGQSSQSNNGHNIRHGAYPIRFRREVAGDLELAPNLQSHAKQILVFVTYCAHCVGAEDPGFVER